MIIHWIAKALKDILWSYLEKLLFGELISKIQLINPLLKQNFLQFLKLQKKIIYLFQLIKAHISVIFKVLRIKCDNTQTI